MTRLFRWLLHLYPVSFRHEYGAEMLAQFAERKARTGGLARLILGLDVLFDTLGNAALVHWDLLRQDVRQGLRNLRHAPGFTTTAIAVIALGIGANAAAFSIADFVFLRPVPYPTAQRLVTIWERLPSYAMMQPSAPNYRDWREQSRSFDQLGAYHQLSASLLGGGSPQEVSAIAIHGPVLDMLGVAPMLGHLPSADEVDHGATVAVLSYPLWRDNFGADPDIVGRVITLEGAPYSVAGVMPKSFVFPDRSVQLWTPMRPGEVSDSERNNNWFYVVARLRPGRTLAQARSEMDRISLEQQRLYPQVDSGVTVMSLRDTYAVSSAAQGATLLEALCGAAICVLLISCANLASLLLVRAMTRRRELAVRAALGAGRERLMRQLLTESLMLALAGGAVGVGLAFIAMPLLDQLVPATLPLARLPSIDIRVLVVAVLLSLLTGVGFGVVPAFRAGARSLDGLRDGVRSGGGRRARLRASLVMLEVAASVVLLVSAGLLLRAMWRVRAVDPGFRVSQVMTLRTQLPFYRYWRVRDRTAFFRGVLERVRALPGVQAAGYISYLPMKMGGGIWIADVTPDTGNRHVSLRFVTPGYFAAMGIRLLRGRDVTDGDTPAAPMGAIVSQSLVRRFWRDQDPIGQHFKVAFADRTVVGVVQDVRVRGPERDAEPQVYLPYQQMQDSSLYSYVPKDLAIRSTLAPGALVPAVRRIIKETDPLQSVSQVEALSSIVADQSLSRTVQLRVLLLFAALAFILAGVGLHGLLAFAVSQRRQEFAIRRALGAQGGEILGMVMREAGWLALGGILPGAALGYLAGRAMTAVLAGVPAFDVPTFIAAAVLCAVMIGVGSMTPALRAAQVDPSRAMRVE